MWFAISVIGFFLAIIAFICFIVFGIILIIKLVKHRPKKAMNIASLLSLAAVILGTYMFFTALDKLYPDESASSSSDSSTSVSISDDDDSDSDITIPDDESSSSTDNISLSKAKTASQLTEAAAVADPDNFKKASIRDGISVIELKDSGEWDEKTTVQNFALRVTDFLNKEKSNPNFNSFAFIRKAEFTDEKGNEKTETAIIAYFTKKNVKSINYDNFSDIVGTDPYKFYDVSDGYYINPAIFKKVESSFNGLPAYKNSKDHKLSDDFYSELGDAY